MTERLHVALKSLLQEIHPKSFVQQRHYISHSCDKRKTKEDQKMAKELKRVIGPVGV